MSKISKVARASIVLMIGTILSKVLGFARELMVAYRFGAGSISDAFVLTNSIPTLIFVSVATAININYIPYYHRIDGEEERNRFTSNLTNISAIIPTMISEIGPVHVIPSRPIKIGRISASGIIVTICFVKGGIRPLRVFPMPVKNPEL